MMANLRMHRSERGVSLAEVLVALVILAFVGVAVIAGVFTSIKSNETARTRISAESLARSEIEFVYSQPYVATNWTYILPDNPSYPAGWDATHSMPEGYAGYLITVSASENNSGTKSSKQKITAAVSYNGSPVLTIVTYQAQ